METHATSQRPVNGLDWIGWYTFDKMYVARACIARDKDKARRGPCFALRCNALNLKFLFTKSTWAERAEIC